MHPLLLMITSSSSLQYAEYPKYNGWSFRGTLKIEKKKNKTDLNGNYTYM